MTYPLEEGIKKWYSKYMDICLKCSKNIKSEPKTYQSTKYCSHKCQILYLKSQYRKKYRARMNEYNQRWKKENPEKMNLQRRNYYLKKHGYYPEDRPKIIKPPTEEIIYRLPCGFCPDKVFISKRRRKHCPVHARLGNKSIRFEILKRDSFTCQYCGRKSPEVLLHIDHIFPKAKGGTNETTNLITSCFDCNIGKRDVLL